MASLAGLNLPNVVAYCKDIPSSVNELANQPTPNSLVFPFPWQVFRSRNPRKIVGNVTISTSSHGSSKNEDAVSSS